MAPTANANDTALGPDPKIINAQKDAYLKMLDEQGASSLKRLEAQVAFQNDAITRQCKLQKDAFCAKIDMEAANQLATVQLQKNDQEARLKQELMKQKSELDRQSRELIIEYEARKVSVELMAKQKKIDEDTAKMTQALEATVLNVQPTQADLMAAAGSTAAQKQAVADGNKQGSYVAFGSFFMGIPKPTDTIYVYGPNGELVPKNQ